jgi:hypothetical protein
MPFNGRLPIHTRSRVNVSGACALHAFASLKLMIGKSR